MTPAVPSPDTYIVVGAGVFGASTALELVQAGHRVIVLDRSIDGHCAPDAASHDLNKIVRADYSDPHYRALAKQAISAWRRSPLLKPYYHEVGVLFHTGTGADPSASQAYVKMALNGAAASNEQEIPYPGQTLPSVAHRVDEAEQVRACFPLPVRSHLGALVNDVANGRNQAYMNPRGGWAEANEATRVVLDEAQRLGATVYGCAHVVDLLFDHPNDPRRVTGVRCSDGRIFHTSGAGQTVLCVGAWAEAMLRDVVGKGKGVNQAIPTWSSAQVVISLQLTPEQQQRYQSIPVVLCFENGAYCFEPTKEGLMKIAIHGAGYRYPLPSMDHTQPPTTYPSFADSTEAAAAAATGTAVTVQGAPQSVVKEAGCPADLAQIMMSQLGYVYPELAQLPIRSTRICYYSESLDENWIIDHVPNHRGLVLASGDSGHGFKFLPLIGSLICARMGLPQVAPLTAHQRKVFSFAYHADLHRQQEGYTHQRETSSFKARL